MSEDTVPLAPSLHATGDKVVASGGWSNTDGIRFKKKNTGLAQT